MPYYKGKEGNMLFVHIPKTGGTSIENYLKKKYTQSLYSGIGNNLIPDEKCKLYSLQHQTLSDLIKYKDILKIDLTNDLFIFSVVRNPYTRIVSDLFFQSKFKKRINANTTKEEVNILLKEYFTLEGLSVLDNHDRPQYEFLMNDNDIINPRVKIFKTENLTDGLINHGWVDYKKPNNVSKLDYFNFLNEDSISMINDRYIKDFELFNYKIL